MSSRLDYDYIEKAFVEAIGNMESTNAGQQFYNELAQLAQSIHDFKAFMVLGGSYQERLMTAKSDLDFWIMLYGSREFSIAKRRMNRLFREGIVEPVFDRIHAKYPNCRPCGSSVRVFTEFTKQMLGKPTERIKKRISAGLKIISFGKVVNVNRKPFAGKSEYVQLRTEFKDFWKSQGIDIWNVWGDLTEKLDKRLRNLKRYKGKSLYRSLQLSVQQMSEAYGFPEKCPRALSLQEKISSWTGRPTFAKERLRDIGRIMDEMRNRNKRVNQLSIDDFNKLNQQLSLFANNLYKPFRRWFKTLASALSLFDALNVGVNYFGISKNHTYIVFSKLNNPFTPIKGIDFCEFSSAQISILANLGRVNKDIADSLQRHGSVIMHEKRDPEGQIFHDFGFKGKNRTHVHLGNYSEKDVISQSQQMLLEIREKLVEIKTLLS
jgi:hypothetical protein